MILEGLFGSVEKVVSTKDLIDTNTLAKLTVKCIVLKHPQEECKKVKGSKYAEEIDYLVDNSSRNIFISNLCDNLSGNTLVLFQLVEKHGKVLYDMMKDFDRKVFFVYGGTDTETRENIRAITEKEKDQRSLLLVMVLLALVSIFAIFTTSCSQVHLNQEYECYNQSDEDCVLHQLKIPL